MQPRQRRFGIRVSYGIMASSCMHNLRPQQSGGNMVGVEEEKRRNPSLPPVAERSVGWEPFWCVSLISDFIGSQSVERKAGCKF